MSGLRKQNRTGIDHIGYQGDMCKYDLRDGFPAVTTKKLAYSIAFAEMLGFLRGYESAADFRKLGCKVWDANANENTAWLANPHRKGEDDLGPVYGAMARRWPKDDGSCIDQLRQVVDDLTAGKDNRREIVTHWNPGVMDRIALPPCHMFYQFGLEEGVLNLGMYQRSCDVPLGVPFNIAGYAWLLSVVAHITGHTPGVFTHFLWDIHIYENQMELMREQVEREPMILPRLWINPEIKTLEDLETWVTPDDFKLVGYNPHPAIKYPFAV